MHLSNSSAVWMRASLLLNECAMPSFLCARTHVFPSPDLRVLHVSCVCSDAYGDVVATASAYVKLLSLLAFVVAPVTAGLQHRNVGPVKLARIATLLLFLYSLVLSHTLKTALDAQRDVEFPAASPFDFGGLHSALGWVLLIGMGCQTWMVRSSATAKTLGWAVALIMPLHWIMAVYYLLGFGYDHSHCTKEAFGHLVVGAFFLLWATVYLCVGDRKHGIAGLPLERFENRVMILAGVLYAPGELVNGSHYLHMHVITAVAWTVFGLAGTVMEATNRAAARRGVGVAMALSYHGAMMMLHSQKNVHATFVHQFHGGAAIIAGLLRMTGRYTETGSALMVSGVIFLFSQIGATDTVIKLGWLPANTYVLLTIICGIVATILVLVPYVISGAESSANLWLVNWCMTSQYCDVDMRPIQASYQPLSADDGGLDNDYDVDDEGDPDESRAGVHCEDSVVPDGRSRTGEHSGNPMSPERNERMKPMKLEHF